MRPTRWLVAAVVAVVLLLPARGSLAAYVDTSTATTGTVTAPTLPTVSITCTDGALLGTPTISWSAPSAGVPVDGYRVSYVPSGVSTGVSGSQDVTTTSWQPTSTLLSVVATYSITVATLARGWASAPSNTAKVSITSLAGLDVLGKCVS
ncbi:fibronectin type III domain-containing protein [Nocardioides cheoyonin]|uniref:fibronectin type III domain-containing protein n=1 Tax=Nocardioides cheoyonin TaxID=3156615 RepID=UPI0032B49CCF